MHDLRCSNVKRSARAAAAAMKMLRDVSMCGLCASLILLCFYGLYIYV